MAAEGRGLTPPAPSSRSPPPGAQWGSLACVASYNMSIQLEALNRPRKALRALSDAINVPARARFF